MKTPDSHFSNIPFSRPDLLKPSYRRTPRDRSCAQIDYTQLSVAMLLFGLEYSHTEIIKNHDIETKYDIDGNGAFIFRYRRNREAFDRPTSVLGFSYRDGVVYINQLQGTDDKHVGYRFDASFDVVAASLDLIEENFLKRWIPVAISPTLRASLDNPDVKGAAYVKYERLALGIEVKMRAYWLEKK